MSTIPPTSPASRRTRRLLLLAKLPPTSVCKSSTPNDELPYFEAGHHRHYLPTRLRMANGTGRKTADTKRREGS
jgi:hypothetical protein